MKHQKHAIIAAVAGLMALGAGSAQPADTAAAVGTDVGTRLVLAFDVDDAAAAAWLPAGARLVQVGRGPYKGADLLLVMNHWALHTDPDGEALERSGDRGVVVAGFGIPEGGDRPRLFVNRMYQTAPDADPYEVSVSAAITHSTSLETPAAGAPLAWESWSIEPDGGGRLDVTVSYEPGTPVWSTGTSKPYSASKPDLHRVYEWSQLADVALSEGMGKPLDGAFSFASSIPELAAVFDGSEKLLAIVALPTYYRDTFEPNM